MQGNPIFMQQAIALATENVVSGRGGPSVRSSCATARCGHRRQPGHCHQRPHRPRRGRRHPQRLLYPWQLPAHRLRDLHQLRTLPHVPRRHLLVAMRRHLLRQPAADAATAGFDDAFLYDEIKKPRDQRSIPTTNLLREQAFSSFAAWREYAGRIDY